MKFEAGQTSVRIASGLDKNKTSTIKLVRETEEKYGAFTALSLDMGYHGELGDKPLDKAAYIEFLGDSITSGLGSLCGYLSDDGLEIKNEQTSTSTGKHKCGDSNDETSLCQDATNSYAYLAAESLGADCSLVSYSGIGVTAGFTMSEYFTYASKCRNEQYNFTTARKPDLVVINLGTNDSFKNADTEAFKTEVKALIKQVRTAYGEDTEILWATGLMSNEDKDAYKTYAAAAISELGYANVHHFDGLTEGRSGHNGHPTKDQQKTAAQQLVNEIAKLAIVDTQKTAEIGSQHVPAGYSLAWSEGFSGSSISDTKMVQKACMGENATLKVKKENLTIENGTAVLSAKYEGKNEAGENVYSAVTSLTTKDVMAFRYGYVEMRAKVPTGVPIWPSLWLQSQESLRNSNYMTEVDIFEVFANYKVSSTYHKWYTGEDHQQQPMGKALALPANSSNEYHTYAMKWTPDSIEMYFDGTLYGQIKANANFSKTDTEGSKIPGFDDPLYLILNNHVFTQYSRWAPSDAQRATDADNGKFPIDYTVDYIRIYQDNTISGSKIYNEADIAAGNK